MVTPAARRVAVRFFRDEFGLSERVACQLSSMSRSSFRRKRLREEADRPLRQRMLELAAERPRFGYRRWACCCAEKGARSTKADLQGVQGAGPGGPP